MVACFEGSILEGLEMLHVISVSELHNAYLLACIVEFAWKCYFILKGRRGQETLDESGVVRIMESRYNGREDTSKFSSIHIRIIRERERADTNAHT